MMRLLPAPFYVWPCLARFARTQAAKPPSQQQAVGTESPIDDPNPTYYQRVERSGMG